MSVSAANALSAIPTGLRSPLIEEYQSIVQNFLEHRWLPSELSGGRFAEIVYTILVGYASHSYASKPSKPANFADACKKLEQNASAPRSFQILIPRMLPALYEIRNNRSVGHVGGDVDPNHMDSVAVLSMANWIMAELVRVFHNLDIANAQKVVDAIAETNMPMVWSDGNVRRVLHTGLRLPEQVLLLTASAVPDVSVEQLIDWTEAKDKKHFLKTLRKLHSGRLIEYNADTMRVKVLPPGSAAVRTFVEKRKLGFK